MPQIVQCTVCSYVETVIGGLGPVFGISIHPVEDKIYFVTAHEIRKANLDGANVETLWTSLPRPIGIDLDFTTNTIYWTDIYQGAINRGNTDGAHMGIFLDKLTHPFLLTIDPVENYVYWADDLDRRVYRANLVDGSGVVTVAGNLVEPIGVKIGPSSELSCCKVICSASCLSMGWGLSCESGPYTKSQRCENDWSHGSDPITTCTGTITYQNSGNGYTYDVVYNWPDCSISVNIHGLGVCGDN